MQIGLARYNVRVCPFSQHTGVHIELTQTSLVVPDQLISAHSKWVVGAGLAPALDTRKG
jgi:hypothetical protein